MGLGGREKGRSGLALDFVERAKREREREIVGGEALSVQRFSERKVFVFFGVRTWEKGL